MIFTRFVSAAAVCASVATARAVEPPGYYDSARGTSGLALRRALHHIIRGHRVISYSTSAPGSTNTADALKVLDEDPANTNNVIPIYSRRSEPKATFGLTTGWNREHLWPNSYGLDSRQPAYSDLFNLRPEDATVNSARGNKFDDFSATNSPGYRSPASPEAPLTSTDSDSWEPPTEVKGDVARALLYMAVRYTGSPTNEPALFLTDRTTMIQSTTNLMGRLTTLLLWHRLDPVDESERRRNDRVYELYQRNRNPFVDHPEWAETAFLPALEVRAIPGAVVLEWPAEYSGAQVEGAASLGLSWRAWTNAPALFGDRWQLTVPVLAELQFFRLRLQ